MRKKAVDNDLMAQFEQLSARTAAKVLAVLETEGAEEFRYAPRHLVQAIHCEALDAVRKTLCRVHEPHGGYDENAGVSGYRQALKAPKPVCDPHPATGKAPRKKRIMKRASKVKQPPETHTGTPESVTGDLFHGSQSVRG